MFYTFKLAPTKIRSSRPVNLGTIVDHQNKNQQTKAETTKGTGVSELQRAKLQMKSQPSNQKREDPYVACELGNASCTPFRRAFSPLTHSVWRARLVHTYKISHT